MDLHNKLLERICRLCGNEGNPGVNLVSKSDLSRDIGASLNIDVSGDLPDIHPSGVCATCRLKISRWRKTKNQKKTARPPNIDVVQFSPHSENCTTCEEKQWNADVLVSFFRQNGLFSWTKGDKVIAIEVDSEGDKVVKKVTVEHKQIKCFGLGKPLKLQCVSPQDILDRLFKSSVCTGNTEFPELAELHSGTGFFTSSGEKIATVEEKVYDGSNFQDGFSIRHKDCEVVMPSSTNRPLPLCNVCMTYKTTLSRADKSRNLSDPTFVPNKFLSAEELRIKAARLEKEKNILSQRNKKLRSRIERILREESIDLGNEDTERIEKVVASVEGDVAKNIQPGSYCELLWNEQKKARSTTSKRMRWHPTVIKWAIAIHTKSASAYNLMRNSGFLTLPHPNTLYQYTHFTNPKTGINSDILSKYYNEKKIDQLKDHEKYVSVLIDEMKVTAGLGFSKSTGKLIGCTDVGSVSEEMDKFERRCTEGADKEPQIASHVLLFMARGITSNLKFPIAYYATGSVTGTQLYQMTNECIKALKLMGLNVLCLVSDGASSNRKLYQIMGGRGGSDITPSYSCKNLFEDGTLFFVCDAPHLLKTIRNNFENSNWNRRTRNLVFQGQRIQWSQLIELQEWDQGRDRNTPGLRLAPKLSYEHLHLTPGLRMKVSLAAQVMSSTVANALEMMGKPGLQSTALFIRKVNKFFDCLNVAKRHQGQRQRNENLLPYTSVEDPRLKWLVDDLLGFFFEWEQEGTRVEGLTKKEQAALCLSRPTLAGIYITVHSFVEVVKTLLSMDGVDYILSDKLNQDPLEEFFGKQRAAGGHHENPTLEQFGHALLRNIAAGSWAGGSSRGNVRVRNEGGEVTEEPLPKRRRHQQRFGISKESPH